MPIIPYEIQKDICKIWRGKKYWRSVKQRIDVDVSEEVAAFLADSDKYDKRYDDKIRKQIKVANIIKVFSLNEEEDIFDDTAKYELEETTEDTVHPENRNPLSILIKQEDAAILNYFYSDVMRKKRYGAFKLHEEGYNKTEIAALLNIDESSARERLEIALICAVEFYIVHSNAEILQGLHDFIFKELQGKIPKTKYQKLVGTAFRKLIYLIRPDQRELINYIIKGEHKKEIKKYLDTLEQTPENAT